jgi:hypothetical protein
MMDRFVISSSFGCQAGHQLRRSRSLGGRDVPERGQHLLPGLGVAGVNQHGHDDQLRHRHGGVIVSGRWSVYPVAVQGPRSVPRRDQRRGLQSGEPLLRVAEAKSVRVRDGKMQVTGGPPSNAQPGSQQPLPAGRSARCSADL